MDDHLILNVILLKCLNDENRKLAETTSFYSENSFLEVHVFPLTYAYVSHHKNWQNNFFHHLRIIFFYNSAEIIFF